MGNICCGVKAQKRYDIKDVTGDMELDFDADLLKNDNFTRLKVDMPFAYNHINFYMG